RGTAFIGSQFVGKLLRIKAPPFSIDGIIGELADIGNSLGLKSKRDLMVMARRGLMIGERGQRPAGIRCRVAQVDVISTRPRTIERGKLIISARRTRLDLWRDA